MNKYDWIVVGMCLYGIHLVVQGILGVFAVAAAPSLASFDLGGGVDLSDYRTSGFLQGVVHSFLGSFLILLSLKIASSQAKGFRLRESN